MTGKHVSPASVGKSHDNEKTLRQSEEVWFKPMERSFDADAAVREFLMNLAASLVDLDRMVRVGVAPNKKLARPAILAMTTYLARSGQISPVLARLLVERNTDLKTRDDIDTVMLANAKAHEDQEKASRKSKVERRPTAS